MMTDKDELFVSTKEETSTLPTNMEIYDGNEDDFDSDIEDIPIDAGGKAASNMSPQFGQETRPMPERTIPNLFQQSSDKSRKIKPGKIIPELNHLDVFKQHFKYYKRKIDYYVYYLQDLHTGL